MAGELAQPVAAAASPGPLRAGRMFVHPVFDYLLIGGGLSLIATAVILPMRDRLEGLDLLGMAYLILVFNMAHFAASTVRLYTKPGAARALPFLSAVLPLIMVALLTLCIGFANQLGRPLQTLYVMWSPYHYAAQAYGLAVMYCYRSGCLLKPGEKKALWWIAMLPFAYMLTNEAVFFVPDGWLPFVPAGVMSLRLALLETLRVVGIASPFVLFFVLWRSKTGPMPLISLMVIFANGIWFFVLNAINAFVWATIFHGIQYLAIVIIFHVKDQRAREDNRHGTAYHVIWFYAVCVLLGYTLFRVLPGAYVFAGFGLSESMLLTVAAINIHHFIVDGYIWRLKKTDTNRRIVDSAATA